MAKYVLDQMGILTPLTKNKVAHLEEVEIKNNCLRFTENYRDVPVVSLLKIIGRRSNG
jgi:hypothetical protein